MASTIASHWKPYPSYKESVERKSMQIPGHWDMIPNRHLMKLRNQKVGEDWSSTDLLSLTLQGIIPRDIDSGVGKYPASFETYQIVEKDDLVFCLFDVAETPRTIGISNQRGMITGAYDVMICVDGVSPHYVHDYYLALDFIKGLEPYYTGLRNVVRTDAFNQMKTPIPPLEEQFTITEFIQRIDAITTLLASQLKIMIDLLEEKRLTLITQAVTKGLDPDAPMKDSGIEWIGEIPAEWEVKRMKHIFKIHNGATPKSGVAEYWNGEMNWVTPDDLGSLDGIEIGETSRKITPEGYASCGTLTAKAGSIAISTRAPIGHLAITKTDMSCNQGCRLVVPIISTEIAYFHAFLEASVKELQSLGQGSTFKELPRHRLENLPVLIPTPQEIKPIVDFLQLNRNSLTKTIKNISEKIVKLEEYRSALISAAVTGKIDVRGLA